MIYSASTIIIKSFIMQTLHLKARSFVTKFLAGIFSILLSVAAVAQDKTVDVNISTDKGGGGFFSSPWVWVVGVAVFILLLVALMRGGGSKRDV